ncbi:hypothetical protein QUA30_28140 [Microcoleus sp. Pol14C2]|uniref:hypothetical protein n=1 Tax=unclassified Microcoleus TaxID=2642155 RepID=UPI002FD788FA
MTQSFAAKSRLLSLDPLERQALANWVLVWVGLANIGFSLMYFVGSPPRVFEILMFGILGLVVRKQPFAIQAIAFVAGLAFAVVFILSSLFNLPIYSLSRSIIFMSELNALNSLEYIAVGLGLALIVLLACLTLRRPSHFTDHRAVLIAFVAIAVVALLDAYMGHGMRGHYKRLQSEDAPFSSAMSNAGAQPNSRPC